MSFEIDFLPGVVKRDTAYATGARWFDSLNIRFVGGLPEKLGGWAKYIAAQTLGKVRGLLGWVTSEGTRNVILGTYIKLYGMTDSLQDITPLRASGTLANDPFAVVDTSTTVTVTHIAHGLEVGAYVTFDGATAGGGITIDGEYVVVSVVGANSYTITHSAPATSTDATTGGAAVLYEYQINPGYEDTSYGVGYGAGPYGASLYGTPRTGVVGIELEARSWSIATFGENVLVSPSGGTIYEWDEAGGDARATAVTNAPASVRYMFVTSEGFLVALGTTTAMTLAWPDRDDITVWTPTLTNRANIRKVNQGSRLIAGAALSDINVFWSDVALYRMQYLGDLDVIYDTTPILAANAGLIGPLAFCVAGYPGNSVYWMSHAQFMMYEAGVARPIPNQMDIREYVYRNLDRSKAYKCWVGYNAKKGEVEFGFVMSGEDEVSHSVLLNLQDYSWTPTERTRTGMTYMPTPLAEVIMPGADLYVYEHETGVNADGAAMEWRLQSGLLDLSKADRDMDVDRFINDMMRQTGPFTLTVELFERPNSVTPIETADFIIDEGAVEQDMHMGGRHAQITFAGETVNGDWRMGKPLFSFKPAGRR